MRIATPLGEDFLLIKSLSVTEALSTLFQFKVTLLHEEPAAGYEPTIVDVKKILGRNVTVGNVKKSKSGKRT